MNEASKGANYDSAAAKTHFIAWLNRHRDLLQRRWWVLLLGALVGVGLAGIVARSIKPAYVSVGRMMVSNKLAIPEGATYSASDDMMNNNFFGTQAALMESDVVSNRASLRVMLANTNLMSTNVAGTNLPAFGATLKVTVSRKTSIFMLQGTSGNPEFAQAFVQACMEEYINLKRDMRKEQAEGAVGDLTEEVLTLEKDLRNAENEMVEYQSTNSLVWLQQQGNSVGAYIASVNQKLADMKSEYSLLQTLTLDQNLERQKSLASIAAGTNVVTEGPLTDNPTMEGDRLVADYLKAKQDLLLMKADLEDLGQYLRPEHPKMVAMSEDIARRERLLEIFRQQSVQQLEGRKTALAVQIQNLEKDLKDWDEKVLDLSRRTAEYERLKGNAQRIQTLYERLLATVQSLDVSKGITQESVMILENASPAHSSGQKRKVMIVAAGMGCMMLALGLLLMLDHLDSRLNSVTELAEQFEETVLGQVPLEKVRKGETHLGLLEPEDQRHGFLEAYRSLRSSLVFVSDHAKLPQTLLVTSSVPDEGKSLTSANLAIMLALAGTRVLLVDADLRKGLLHKRFGMEGGKGLSDVLARGAKWEDLVQTTKHPNLSVLIRGKTTHNSSELFLGEATARFLSEVTAKYDCVLLDTVPVMAAADVTSLAPQVQAVLFVIRAEFTPARVARAALGLLYQRKAKVLGLMLNAVRRRSSDYYYYYKYNDYYAKAGEGEGKE